MFVLLNVISIWFIVNPEIFIRNFLMKIGHIQIIGFLMFLYSLIMLCSFIFVFFCRKEALIISENYLIDNSKFESVGKLYFNNIQNVNRLKKRSIEIVLKEPIFEIKKMNWLKKIAFILNNWNYKNSFIISSALINADIEDIEEVILSAIKKYNHRR